MYRSLVNNSALAGHVFIGENAIIGGNTAIHQFVNIGKYAMIGGMSGVESNIVPYALYTGIRNSNLRGLNLLGLKRKGLDKEKIQKIFLVFKKIFKHESNIEKNINNLLDSEKNITEISEIIKFINLNLKRGITRYSND